MDETRLHNRIAKATRAAQELDSLGEAFKTLGEQYMSEWANTASDDVARREQLYASYALLARVEAALRSMAGDRDAAQRDLDYLKENRAH